MTEPAGPARVGNRYELGELLGRGGMAEVRKGTDVRLGRTVAIKRLRTDLASDVTFQARFRREAEIVVKERRQHACIALWAGDNENDSGYVGWWGLYRDPGQNRLTREVLPQVLQRLDPHRPYLPSSPFITPSIVALKGNERIGPEQHLWGPRDYYKSNFYANNNACFASETGYHGCPAPKSIEKFISPDKIWPYHDNEEWQLHSTSPVPDMRLFDGRVQLMEKQVRELFGTVPDNLASYALASQISQAEAKKFFVELFRTMKWRRTGILWWNLMDGWPQFSDAIVDYYFNRKLAYQYLKRSQMPLCLVLREPSHWEQGLIACNDTRIDLKVRYSVTDQSSGQVVLEGEGTAWRDASTELGRIPFSMGSHRLYVIRWGSDLGTGANHYLAGNPPFDFAQYGSWMLGSGLLNEDWLRQNSMHF